MIVRCAGGKAPRVVDIKPFDAACPGNGMTPFMEDWFVSFASTLEGKPYLFRSYRKASAADVRDGGSVAVGWAVLDESASNDMVADMFNELVAMLGMTKERRVKAGLTAYGMRHLLPDITRALGWSLVDRTELGRWAPSVIRDMVSLEVSGGRPAKRRAVRSMRFACANLYSRGKAALEREVRLRREACWLVRRLVGNADWREVVPIELDGPPSFKWLSGADARSDAEDGVIIQEDEEDGS